MANSEDKKLAIDVIARIDKLEKGMAKASQVVDKQTANMEKRFAKMNKGITSGLSGLTGKATAAFATIASTAAAIKIVDTATKIQNALKVAGLRGAELKSVYEQLYAAAQKNGVPVEALATLYGKAAQAQKELGASTGDLISFSGNVALALRVAGTDAEAASGALLQLGQALGSGTVHAEEFNSVLEGAPTIVKAVAAGLKEAGGSVARLKQLVVDGKISSEAFFRAFEAGAPVLDAMAKGSTLTIAQQFTQLENAIVDAAGKMDTATGASSKLGSEIQELAGYITALGDTFARVAKTDIGAFIGKIYESYAAAKELKTFLGGWTGTFSFMNQTLNDAMNGRPVGKTVVQSANKANQDYAQSRINDAFSADPKTGRIQVAPAVKPVSVKDFKPPAGKTKNEKAPPRTANDRINEDVQATKDRTAALVEETAIVGKSYVEQEKRRMALHLEAYALKAVREEARKKGDKDWENAKLTPEQISKIDAASDAYAKQADVLRQVQEQQDRAESSAKEFYDTAKSGFADVITGAASLQDALSGLAKKLADLALNSAFDSIFGGTKTTSSGGALTGIFKALGLKDGGIVQHFATGGNVRGPGGPRSDSIPAMLSNGEYVVNAASTKQNRGLLEAINSGKSLKLANGGYVGPSAPRLPTLPKAGGQAVSVHVTYNPVNDNRGADAAAVARLEQAQARDRKLLPSQVVAAIRDAKARGVKI